MPQAHHTHTVTHVLYISIHRSILHLVSTDRHIYVSYDRLTFSATSDETIAIFTAFRDAQPAHELFMIRFTRNLAIDTQAGTHARPHTWASPTTICVSTRVCVRACAYVDQQTCAARCRVQHSFSVARQETSVSARSRVCTHDSDETKVTAILTGQSKRGYKTDE